MKRFWLSLRESDIRNVLAVIITVGVFSIMYLLIIKEVPQPNHDIVIGAVGFIFGGAMGAVCGYFFSASKVDKKMDQVTNKTE